MSARRALLGLAAATGAVYAALLWFGVVRLTQEAGGLPPFDVRPLGYDHAAAEAYLAALSEAGQHLRLGPVGALDTAFPIMLGVLLAALLWRLGRPWLAPLPLLYSAADLWENARVRAMIEAGPERVTPAMAEGASAVTQGKYALLVMSLALLWAVWRRR
ncbi:hypothetical protein [Rhodosalinus sp.]|uniref:hypothetical protein n=1 Tax=Rhodosalinus sp. TaxID=2047741 RepID=UPI0035668863